MVRKWILSAALLFAGGCGLYEKASEYDWSREAPVRERIIVIHTSLPDPQVQFAASEILSALKEKGYPAVILRKKDKYRGNTRITLSIDSAAGLKPEGYFLTAAINDKGNPQFVITGADATGAMYGGLHLAEAIRIEETLLYIRESREEPYIAQRGLKMNIPLDARTSGSVNVGDSWIRNVTEMGKVDFWTEFLDAMARYRYNVLMLRIADGPEGMSAAFRKNTDLWRRVMQYAKERGIQIYALSADSPGTEADMEQILRDSMRELIQTVPDLAGLGAAAGGSRDSVGRIMETGKEYPQPDMFDLTFRYARARLYSSPSPSFHAELLESMRSRRLKCWWDLDNGDIFVHRWGDPDYVRQCLMNFPLDQTAGYYLGSDGYVWGREFTDLDYKEPRQPEIVKHRYSFMLWGRLGYNPNLDRAFFEKVLHAEFPTADPALLYEAWQASSKIIPLVNRFHWRDWDYMWSPEGCMGAEGFHTVLDFIDPEYGTMEGSGLVSIPDTVTAVTEGRDITGTAPEQVADQIDGWADEAIEKADRIKLSSVLTGELAQTLEDIEAMAWLGKYYAAKIRGSFEYALYKASGQSPLRQSAVEHLQNASECWRNYARKDTSRYRPQVLARTGKLDWWELWEEVKKDIDIVRKE